MQCRVSVIDNHSTPAVPSPRASEPKIAPLSSHALCWELGSCMCVCSSRRSWKVLNPAQSIIWQWEFSRSLFESQVWAAPPPRRRKLLLVRWRPNEATVRTENIRTNASASFCHFTPLFSLNAAFDCDALKGLYVHGQLPVPGLGTFEVT